MLRRRENRAQRFVPASIGAGLLIAVSLAGGNAAAGAPPQTAAAAIIEGTVLTMDRHNSVAEAVAVDGRGLILGVGRAGEVRRDYQGPATQIRRLRPGEVLLPGFIEPHQHLIPFILSQGTDLTDLSPCLPGPYGRGDPKDCSNFIRASLARMRPTTCAAQGAVLFGLDLDPSRQPYDASTPATAFRSNPRSFIEQEVCAEQPVVTLDQSGHFGYVNKAAFDALQSFRVASKLPWPPQFDAGGAWAPSATPDAADNSRYSGFLIEEEAYMPFLDLIGATDTGFKGQLLRNPSAVVQDRAPPVTAAVNALRAAGVTTVVSIADSKSEAQAVAAVATLSGSPLRTLRVVRPPVLTNPPQGYGPGPLAPACDPRRDPKCALPQDLGYNAVKVTVDGSTQGCTAAMQEPLLYASTGPCAKDAEGRDNARGYADLNSSADIVAQLSGFWNTGQWRFETHVNGNRAMQMTLDAYAQMQQQQPLAHRVVLVHATVGDPAVFGNIAKLRGGTYRIDDAAVPALDVRVTHLIGHIPYWGGAFESILGAGPAANIDPIGSLDLPLGIPWTLHSDATVSLPRPLWFIAQAVGRETWYYPQLSDQARKVLGPENAVTVAQALRAVTIAAAEEKELDGWLGSIEAGKVADFVVLADNPLDQDARRGNGSLGLADIKVVDTYINGRLTTAMTTTP